MTNTSNRWIIAIAGILMQIALGAVYAWSVFRIPLAVQFGRSIPEVTLTFNISIFVVGIAAFAGGLWMKSPRAACRRGQRDQSPPPPRRSTRSWGRLRPPRAAVSRDRHGSSGQRAGSSAADRGVSELSAGRRPERY